MACLLFLGFRMRVLQLTKGEGNPQGWARFCMEWVAYSIAVNTLIALIIPVFTDHEVQIDEKTGELKTDENSNPFSNSILRISFTVLRYFTFLGLYVGFGGVCVGIFLFEPPKDVWEGPVTDISPAVACTMTLSTAFFLVYLLMAISRSYTQFTAGTTGNTHFEHTMEMAASTMDMVLAVVVRPLLGLPHARASDGPGPRQPAALGAKLLLRVHVRDHRADVRGGLRPLGARGQGAEG